MADKDLQAQVDRFTYRLRASERAVIFCPADESSVIRKPALKPDLTADDGFSPVRRAQPYTLLLPRGTKGGMKFRLLVMCSDGKDLDMPNPRTAARQSATVVCRMWNTQTRLRWVIRSTENSNVKSGTRSSSMKTGPGAP